MATLVSSFSSESLNGNIYQDNLIFIVKGRAPSNSLIKYSASAPADLRMSYAGSGLPFATPEQAYSNSPNIGETKVEADGSFEFLLYAPNSYYVHGGTTLLLPHVHLAIKTGSSVKTYRLKLGPGIPNRSLKNLDNRPNRSTGR